MSGAIIPSRSGAVGERSKRRFRTARSLPPRDPLPHRSSAFRALALALCLPLVGGNGGPLLLGHLFDVFEHTCGCPIDGREHECRCRQCLLSRTHARPGRHVNPSETGDGEALRALARLGDDERADTSPSQATTPSSTAPTASESTAEPPPCHGAGVGESTGASESIARASAVDAGDVAVDAAAETGGDPSATDRNGGVEIEVRPAPCATAFGDGMMVKLPLLDLPDPDDARPVPSVPLTLPAYDRRALHFAPPVPVPPPRSRSFDV